MAEPRLADAGRAHAIATPHAAASAAGDAVFRSGGTAFDAAVAAAVALTVVYPHMCAVGGDIIALAATPGGAVRVVNGSGAAPAGVVAADVAARHGGMPERGAETVTVPGAVAAWATLLELGGSRRLADLIEPAARMAEEGVPVARSLGAAIAAAEADGGLAADEGMAAVFRPGGTPLATGDALVQPALARTLRALQADGPDALYRGPVGAAVVACLQSLGSAITTDDLAAHATELGEPLATVFGDEEVLTAPPNSQGLLLLEILQAATRLGDVDLLGADADLLAELFRLVTLDRDRFLADPRRADVPVAALLSERHATKLAEAALARRAGRPDASGATGAKATGDTIAVVAADGAGNAVSLIQSVYYGFGSGILDPTTGVVLHNRGAFFSVEEGSPNVLEGGKRPGHTLMPVLVRRGGRLVGVHGTMGGSAQAQIHAQLILRTARGESPADAVSGARFVVGGLEPGGRADLVLAEPGCGPDAERAWAAAGQDAHRLAELDEETGHAQLIRIGADGALRAASDPRADGAALAG